ncbi:MAG: DNA cytosine methyltransferase [Pseudomonadota bacterium]
MAAYYNENDPKAAAWLRELIRRKLIADGEVDERSIEDVEPGDLATFRQCHFFAGIGGWSEALRRAGIADDVPYWTGSCPCQPFSPAGKGEGFDDKRHLWPAFFHLIEICRPQRVYGEQVAGRDGLAWLDLVQSDVEACGYTLGSVIIPAGGFGAPHGRARLYWVADAAGAQHTRTVCHAEADTRKQARLLLPGAGRETCELADASGIRHDRTTGAGSSGRDGAQGDGANCALGNPDDNGRQSRGATSETARHRRPFVSASSNAGRPGPTNGEWRTADWIWCRDERWRPVEPGLAPLADGLPARVVRVRGYGNAIVPAQAAAFVAVAEDVMGPLL